MSVTLDGPVAERPVGSISELDSLLGSDGLFHLESAEAVGIRVRHVRDAVALHLDRNSRYREYAARCDFDLDSPDAARGTSLLDAVPLLPTSVFKRPLEHVRTGDDPVITTTSSGTLGTISRVPRDDVTLMRFYATVTAGIRGVLGVEDSTTPVLNLLPPVDQVEHLWVSYVMSGVALLFPSTSYVDGVGFDVDALLGDLAAVPASRSVGLVGPPSLLLEVAVAAAAAGGLRLPSDSIVIAMGGWKRRQSGAVDRSAFDGTVAAALGLDPSRVRDAFNMVELNTVIVECEHKRKHCPPWLYARARDPRTLRPLPSGVAGVLSFLDATATSYPGFVLSDDLGSVDQDVACPCGRRTDVLRILRRVRRTESRGCALKIEPEAG
jgi:long-chain-fatty-acid---luciferin-component ligase